MSGDGDMPSPAPGLSAVEGAEIVFRLADPEHRLSGVRLWQELGLEAELLEFKPVDAGWELRLPRPSVHRMEYLFEVRDADGDEESCTDPTNPLLVSGAFGEHSWLPLPGYTAPAWTTTEPVPSTLEPLPVPDTPVGTVDLQVWAPADVPPTERLPLLLSHDGPEFASYAGLTQYAGAMIADGRLPRMRLALVEPGERNAWYAANPDYATALVRHVLPAVLAAYATEPRPVLMGASLGALAGLHAEWTHPGTFAGLFLQSGSFFTTDTDPQESGFSHFAEVTGFVRTVLAADTAPSTPLIGMTCGSVEENVHNNRVMAARLSTLGCDVEYQESPDMHNFTAWRDVLDPCLTELLRSIPRGTTPRPPRCAG
jgi:enterochelin esterase-like enzyme